MAGRATPSRAAAGSKQVTETTTSAPPSMVRRFGLLHATALNMTNMIGIGPFITIPLLMSALGGPQAMLGWVVALITVLCDSTVWSELGAAGLGRLLRLPAPGLRGGEGRPPDGLSLCMAVRAQWAPRDRVRLHRVLALSGIHLEGDHAATDDARD